MTIFIQAHKKNRYNYQKIDIITNESDIDDVFQSIYTIIITNMKNFQEKVQAGLLIQSLNILLVFQSIILQQERVR